MQGEDVTDELELRKEAVRRLREVVDPEIGINIVDLGLVYQIYVEDQKLIVRITVTTPACPMRLYIEQLVQARLSEIAEAELHVVMEPPWSPDMIAEHARLFG